MRLIIVSLVSNWHLYCAEAYLKYNTSITDKDKLIVFINYHKPSERFRIKKEDCLFLKNLNTSFYYIKDSNTINDTIKQLHKNIITEVCILSPKDINLHLLMAVRKINNIICVQFDEGVGTYYSAKLWNLESKMLGNYTKFQDTKEIIKKIIVSILCTQVNKWGLLCDIEGSLIVSKKFVNSMKQYFSCYNICSLEIKEDIHDNDYIFISDNLSLMIDNSHYEILFYEKIFKILKKINKNKMDVWFKPHPNELKRTKFINNIENIGYKVIKSNISSESLFQNRQVKCVGIGSTSLLTASLLFNLCTYTTIDILDIDMLNEYGTNKKCEYSNIIADIKKIVRLGV